MTGYRRATNSDAQHRVRRMTRSEPPGTKSKTSILHIRVDPIGSQGANVKFFHVSLLDSRGQLSTLLPEQ
jgi:hypothetical protein